MISSIGIQGKLCKSVATNLSSSSCCSHRNASWYRLFVTSCCKICSGAFFGPVQIYSITYVRISMTNDWSWSVNPPRRLLQYDTRRARTLFRAYPLTFCKKSFPVIWFDLDKGLTKTSRASYEACSTFPRSSYEGIIPRLFLGHTCRHGQ